MCRLTLLVRSHRGAWIGWAIFFRSESSIAHLVVFDDFDVYANGLVRIYFLDVRDSGSIVIPFIFSGVSVSWVLDRVLGFGVHLFF